MQLNVDLSQYCKLFSLNTVRLLLRKCEKEEHTSFFYNEFFYLITHQPNYKYNNAYLHFLPNLTLHNNKSSIKKWLMLETRKQNKTK